jgi:hypothetical protein
VRPADPFREPFAREKAQRARETRRRQAAAPHLVPHRAVLAVHRVPEHPEPVRDLVIVANRGIVGILIAWFRTRIDPGSTDKPRGLRRSIE